LSTVKKVRSIVDHTGSAVLRKPDSGTGSQRLHAQFVVLRQFSHWYALPSFKTMSVKR